MIQRPVNPHLSKDYNESTLSLPPVFINPFDPSARKDSYDSSVNSTKGMPLDRHQIMAQYQPPSFEPSFRPLVLPDIVGHHQRMQSSGGFSALGLEGMDRPATEYRKSKPTLSIYVPPQPKTVQPIGVGDEDYDRIGRTMSIVASPTSESTAGISEEPCAAIGRHMSMPFASSSASEESTISQPSVGKTATTSMKALTSHVSIIPGSQDSFTPNDASMIQTVTAVNGYPRVQHTPKRQSTLVRQDSMSARRAMRFGPNGAATSYQSAPVRQSGPILPLHYQDLPGSSAYHQQQHYGAPLHYRSKSDGAAIQTLYTPWNAPVISSNTWPGQGVHRPAHPFPAQRPNAPMFRVPPPPNHSPVHSRGTSPYGVTYSRTSIQNHISHSRSSSTPSMQQPVAEPIPALLDALRPVLRHSGIYQSAAPPPSRHPFLDDNSFGPGRNAPHTRSSSVEEMSVMIKPEKQAKRSSRLRKALPRNL
jgi:hypothetical protein